MASIGEMLRTAREAQGRSLADLAAELCVMQSYLRAIEDDDVTLLPGSFFFLSFARQYGAILGLDQAEVGRALAAVAETADKPAETSAEAISQSLSRLSSATDSSHLTSQRSSAVRPLDPIVEDTNRRYFAGPLGLSWAGLLAAVVIGSGIFAWWTRPPQTVKVAPAKVVVPSAAGSVTGGSVTGGPVTRGPVTGGSGPEGSALGAPETRVPSAETQGAGVTAQVANGAALQVTAGQVTAGQVSASEAATGQVSTGQAANADDGKQVTLNLSATERTWLSITSHGKVIFSGVLEPSQSKTLQGSEVATMRVGNAGGVDVQWNGKSIGPIGARGQVRTIRFTRENFQFLEPESPDQL